MLLNITNIVWYLDHSYLQHTVGMIELDKQIQLYLTGYKFVCPPCLLRSSKLTGVAAYLLEDPCSSSKVAFVYNRLVFAALENIIKLDGWST